MLNHYLHSFYYKFNQRLIHKTRDIKQIISLKCKSKFWELEAPSYLSQNSRNLYDPSHSELFDDLQLKLNEWVLQIDW